MSIELDQKDLVILERLNKDGRITYSQLGEELNLSVPSIKSRIEKLQKIGVFDYIGIHLNPHTMTSDGAAIIALKVDPDEKDQLFEFLSLSELIRVVYEVIDEYNVNIVTQHCSFLESDQLFESLIKRPEVQHAKISFIKRRVLTKPHRIPKGTKLLNVRCEYCGKQIESKYEVGKFDQVPHYFCCTSCLGNYKKWRKSQLKKKN
jgi:DNA-binding Lrp family transcriptional regulator